ncbi:MAG: NIPSNAP family protein [Deltaproteobacteria bacterium]|nr:NIPSNAP family protein [Deltaproteobacteria bacterium]
MIYLEETLNLSPASPETLDTFVEFAQEQLMPLCERLGPRLMAAWYSDVELFCQVTQILEFDSLRTFDDFRAKAGQDRAWGEYEARLEELAPEQHSRLLEPLGPVPPEVLHEAMAQSQQSPLGAYSLAILEIVPGRMPDFIAGLNEGAKNLPIVASWRPIAGKHNEVIDLWKGALRQEGYQPADEFSREFFRGLRELAPRERLIPVYTLPYSRLR